MTNKPLQNIANPVMQSRTRFLALQTLGPVFKRASRSFTQFSIVVLGPKLEFSLQPRVQATHSKQPFLWLSACCAEIRGHLFAHPFWFSSRGLSLFSGSNQVNTLWTHALQFTRLKELYSHLVLQQSNNLTFLVIELLGARKNPNFVQHVWLRQWRRNLKNCDATNLPNNFHTPPPYHTLGNTGYKAPPDALPNTFLQRSSTSLQLLLRYSALLHKNPPNISVQPSSPTPIYNNLSNLFQDLSTQHFKNNLATTGFPAILHNTFCQQSKIPPFSETLGHVSTVPFPANLYNTLPQHFSAAAFSQPQPLHAVAREDPCTVIHAACLQLVV